MRSRELQISVNADRFVSFRRWHVEEIGWQIDSAAMRPYEGFKTFTIPSPARRENPDFSWVLETVPLKPPVLSGADSEVDSEVDAA